VRGQIEREKGEGGRERREREVGREGGIYIDRMKERICREKGGKELCKERERG
jgi:hypothetical protein